MRWGLLVVACTACGRLGFAPAGDGAEAGDSGPDAPFPTGPFGPATPVPELDSAVEEDDVSLTGDMLEIYFNSRRSGATTVWCSTRASVTDSWSPPFELTELGPANNPRVALDGLTIYLTLPGGVGGSDIMFARRASRGASWSTPQLLPGVSTVDDDFEAWLDADELVIYFTTLPPTGPNGIARAERTSTSQPFGPFTFVTPLSTPSYDGGTWVREDERLLIYHSDVTGSRDIYMSTRASTTEPWGTPVAMSDVNTSAADSDVWLSPDGHTIYFVSRRASGVDDIFMATR